MTLIIHKVYHTSTNGVWSFLCRSQNYKTV